MQYLLDASVLITANNQYYPIGRVPEFWDWLLHQGFAGRIKIPREIMKEILVGGKTGVLRNWLIEKHNRQQLLLEEQVDRRDLNHVLKVGYSGALSPTKFRKLRGDPFLIAYCLVDRSERSVVTCEVSRPSRAPRNRHIPDACRKLGVNCYDPFQLNEFLDFRTNWRV